MPYRSKILWLHCKCGGIVASTASHMFFVCSYMLCKVIICELVTERSADDAMNIGKI